MNACPDHFVGAEQLKCHSCGHDSTHQPNPTGDRDMHTSTSAERDENRLTDADRLRISTRVAELGEQTRTMQLGERITTMLRAAAHAIGCATYDLRDSELGEIERTVRGWIEHDVTAHPNQRGNR